MLLRTASLAKASNIPKYIAEVEDLPTRSTTLALYGNLMFEYLTQTDYSQRQIGYGSLTINYFSPYDLSLLIHEVFVRHVYACSIEKETPFIIDCGSNIGLSTLYFKTIYPEAHVIGFEAHPHTFEILEKNIKDNSLENVTAHNVAVYDRVGTIDFPRSSHAPGHPGMSINTNNTDTLTVQTVRLSDYIDKEVDFLKIDIEGAEGAVIRDLVQSKKLRLVQQTIIEYHDNGNSNNDLTEILDALHNHGFKYVIQSDIQLPFTKDAHAGMMIYAWKA